MAWSARHRTSLRCAARLPLCRVVRPVVSTKNCLNNTVYGSQLDEVGVFVYSELLVSFASRDEDSWWSQKKTHLKAPTENYERNAISFPFSKHSLDIQLKQTCEITWNYLISAQAIFHRKILLNDRRMRVLSLPEYPRRRKRSARGARSPRRRRCPEPPSPNGRWCPLSHDQSNAATHSITIE